MTRPAVLEIEHLSKSFGAFAAVSDVTLSIAAGEIYALLGANGAGKTTTLRCLAGLLRPSAGAIRVAGWDVTFRPAEARQRLGFLAAGMGLYPRLTVRELLGYFAALHGLDEPTAAARIDALVERFELREIASRRCATLSTGQRQRVSVARAVVHDPLAVALDEPTLGLDVLAGAAVHEFLADERARGHAVLLSTHDMAEVELLADRVGVLARGRLVAEGTLDDVLAAAGERTLARAFVRLARPASDREVA